MGKKMKPFPRPYIAGMNVAHALIETANILYLLDNKAQYLLGLKITLEKEITKLEKDGKLTWKGVSR